MSKKWHNLNFFLKVVSSKENDAMNQTNQDNFIIKNDNFKFNDNQKHYL
jgi:hypothetical protein